MAFDTSHLLFPLPRHVSVLQRPPLGLLTASLAPERPDFPLTLPQCDSRAAPPCCIPQSLALHTSWSADRTASPVPANSGLSCSRCPILVLSWWQAAAKAWSLCTSTQSPIKGLCTMAHQKPCSGDTPHTDRERLDCPPHQPRRPEASRDTHRQENRLKFWKEKEKKERSNYQLTSFGRMFTSPGDGQDTMGCPSFWSMRGKAKQLLGPEKPPHPKIPGDNLEQKCNQLFWGLPFLHSESLVATVRVTDTQLEFPSIIFNELSHTLLLQIQAIVVPHLSLTQDVHDTLAPPQLLTLSLSLSQSLRLARSQPLPPPPAHQPQPLPLDQAQLWSLAQSHPRPGLHPLSQWDHLLCHWRWVPMRCLALYPRRHSLTCQLPFKTWNVTF
ncbi:spermatogenesis-associated protein 31A6-like isoform X1 [Lutra lutra]|uniref:spermatogenesis-associated protein 31A6-like isoform X1 n=1 Tax=Lutra lutra TaxID=9657 RepID=UPI001FD15CE6|nr:spermatogenesis-associated protein 31A6-like isoform X1 [Lutra lutra]